MMSPKTSFDFTSAALSPAISFARTGDTATRTNSSGLVETVLANTARFDYAPVALVCRGLLVEEQRQNILLYSEQFNDAAWGKFRATITANAEVAPDGTTTADKLVEDTTASNTHYIRQRPTYSDGVTYTHTVFAKAAERTRFALRTQDSGSRTSIFDLSTGTVVSAGTGAASIEPYKDGWYRCRMSAPVFGTAGDLFQIFLVNTGTNTSYTGDGVSGIYIWGADSELGSFATSYIPTTTTALTRNADVATITGTAFSGWWRAGPGSILVRALPSTVSGTRPLVQVDDASADNIIALRGNATNPELYIREGGSDQATIDAGTISAAAYRLAGAWAAGNAAAALNSGLAVNGAPGSIPTATQMRLGSDGTNYLNGHLQAVEYWPVRLSNASLTLM